MDAWLLKKFPGRLLEEIDAMDWLRYSRALEAQYIDDIEDLRISGGNDLTSEQWQEIKNNDAVWRRVMVQYSEDEGDDE